MAVIRQDNNPNTPLQIAAYMHCGKCLQELPDGQSPSEYQRVNVGLTKEGDIQVWCVRHEANVTYLDTAEVRESVKHG